MKFAFCVLGKYFSENHLIIQELYICLLNEPSKGSLFSEEIVLFHFHFASHRAKHKPVSQ